MNSQVITKVIGNHPPKITSVCAQFHENRQLLRKCNSVWTKDLSYRHRDPWSHAAASANERGDTYQAKYSPQKVKVLDWKCACNNQQVSKPHTQIHKTYDFITERLHSYYSQSEAEQAQGKDSETMVIMIHTVALLTEPTANALSPLCSWQQLNTHKKNAQRERRPLIKMSELGFCNWEPKNNVGPFSQNTSHSYTHTHQQLDLFRLAWKISVNKFTVAIEREDQFTEECWERVVMRREEGTRRRKMGQKGN